MVFSACCNVEGKQLIGEKIKWLFAWSCGKCEGRIPGRYFGGSWENAHATFSGSDASGTYGGACGYGNLVPCKKKAGSGFTNQRPPLLQPDFDHRTWAAAGGHREGEVKGSKTGVDGFEPELGTKLANKRLNDGPNRSPSRTRAATAAPPLPGTVAPSNWAIRLKTFVGKNFESEIKEGELANIFQISRLCRSNIRYNNK
nr:alpha-expansin 1 [Ipomoea batatas]